jgi:hypothetical protein
MKVKASTPLTNQRSGFFEVIILFIRKDAIASAKIRKCSSFVIAKDAVKKLDTHTAYSTPFVFLFPDIHRKSKVLFPGSRIFIGRVKSKVLRNLAEASKSF